MKTAVPPKWLSDSALDHLRAAADAPDLSATRYVLVDKLGQGGMSSVYRVEDTILGRRVALKVIGFADASGELAARLLHEAKVIARLEHPGIVPVHDVGTLPDGRLFYTMKLVRGQRLDQRVAKFGGLPERLRIFQRICEAVSFAHAHGVLHRDLKPQNVMVGPFGEVLVMDWGLSKLLCGTNAAMAEKSHPSALLAAQTPATGTSDGTILGTPGYMAPEQARGDVASLDQRVDIYSLGEVLKFLLESAFRDPIPKALTAICGKASAAEPQQRYDSAQELASDVAHYLDGLPVQAYPEGPFARLWRWSGKNSAWLLLILAYVLMRALLILWRIR
ncbi:MAG TPA: serine/threonine-protein kinase [Terriglobales bacterium]|jgi:eukaryotic-like serine/threonine-protein kinase|nr:serine/threonine-protein kinase [Terriglobales bacterium]